MLMSFVIDFSSKSLETGRRNMNTDTVTNAKTHTNANTDRNTNIHNREKATELFEEL